LPFVQIAYASAVAAVAAAPLLPPTKQPQYTFVYVSIISNSNANNKTPPTKSLFSRKFNGFRPLPQKLERARRVTVS
jgi:hypothetical protein